MIHTKADSWAKDGHITALKAKNNGVGHFLQSSLGREVKPTKPRAGK